MPNNAHYHSTISQRELTFDNETPEAGDIVVTSFPNNGRSNASSVLTQNSANSPLKAVPRDTFGGGVRDFQGFATSSFFNKQPNNVPLVQRSSFGLHQSQGAGGQGHSGGQGPGATSGNRNGSRSATVLSHCNCHQVSYNGG